MEFLVNAKFSQNEDLRLIRTGNKQLHEATVDPKWGTGADLSSKTLRSGDWHGKDLLGRTIETVRAKITANSLDAQDLLNSSNTPIIGPE